MIDVVVKCHYNWQYPLRRWLELRNGQTSIALLGPIAAAIRVQSERHNVLRGRSVSGVASGEHHGGAIGGARVPFRDQKLGASTQRAAPLRLHPSRDGFRHHTSHILL